MVKTKKASDKAADATKVTRIVAADSGVAREKIKVGQTKTSKQQAKRQKSSAATVNQPTKNPFVALGRYFKGAWVELKQVHWPTRRATWSLTGAVLVFTAIFVAMILLLDFGFNKLFQLILQ